MIARNTFFIIITVICLSGLFYYYHQSQNYVLALYDDTGKIIEHSSGIDILFNMNIFMGFSVFLSLVWCLFLMYFGDFFENFDENTAYLKLEEKYKKQIQDANESKRKAEKQVRDIEHKSDMKIYDIKDELRDLQNEAEKRIDQAEQTKQSCLQQVYQIREEMENLQKQLKLSEKKKSNATSAFNRIKLSKEKIEA